MTEKSQTKNKKFKNDLQFDIKVFENFNILDNRKKVDLDELEEMIDKFVGIRKNGKQQPKRADK